MIARQYELNQFVKNDVYEMIVRPKNQCVVGTKWVFRNKLNYQDLFLRIRWN